MAFQSKNLSVLAYANGFTLWHYVSTTDSTSHMIEPGYFDGASDMLKRGDVIKCVADIGEMANSCDMTVAKNDGGKVVVWR